MPLTSGRYVPGGYFQGVESRWSKEKIVLLRAIGHHQFGGRLD